MTTQKFRRFISDLENLCCEHGVSLCTSGYDGLEVWDLQKGDIFDKPIWANGIEDFTTEK